tara:strand:- start:3477 stop:3893 length:417 start_codon:yes stop_codon:yes gene_type:complete
MAFIKYKGKTKTAWLPMTTSTAVTKNTIASWSSGLLIAATSSTTALSHAGVFVKTIASTDADYATARSVPVLVPLEKNVIWLADVTATLATTDVGGEFDLTDAATVNRGASTVDAVICTGFVSTTKGYFTVNFNAGKQ